MSFLKPRRMFKPQGQGEIQGKYVNIQCKEQYFQHKESTLLHTEAKAGSSSEAVLASLPSELNCFQEVLGI